MTEYGIDISNHQGNFDVAAAKREGFSFATAKVTEGDDYVDIYWARNRDLFREHFPGRFGGYLFVRTNTDPDREADLFVRTLGDLSIPVQIDYEDTKNGGSGQDLANRVRALRDRGCRLLPVYVPRWYWAGAMRSPDLSWLSDVGIWNSHYSGGVDYASTLYGNAGGDGHPGWAAVGGAPVRILQFTEDARVAGQEIDANAIRGTTADVDRIFGSSTPTDEEFGDMDQGQLDKIVSGAAQWSEPQIGNPEAGTIGPRPLRNPENYNVRTPDGAWGRAMLMDLWNEIVFDGYRPLSEIDTEPGSLVAIVLRAHAAAVKAEAQNEQILAQQAKILEALAAIAEGQR